MSRDRFKERNLEVDLLSSFELNNPARYERERGASERKTGTRIEVTRQPTKVSILSLYDGFPVIFRLRAVSRGKTVVIKRDSRVDTVSMTPELEDDAVAGGNTEASVTESAPRARLATRQSISSSPTEDSECRNSTRRSSVWILVNNFEGLLSSCTSVGDSID